MPSVAVDSTAHFAFLKDDSNNNAVTIFGRNNGIDEFVGSSNNLVNSITGSMIGTAGSPVILTSTTTETSGC
jgi:hypothetical protein